MDAKIARGQPEAQKPPELLEPGASPVSRAILLSAISFFPGICPCDAFQLSSRECQSFSWLAREVTFAFTVLHLIFSCSGLNLAFLAGSSPLPRKVSAVWWLFWEMQQYPGDVSYVGEIAGIVGRGERDLCSQPGMGAALKEEGHRDDLEDVQKG